ncbi:hypothetical protein CHU98_g11186 [Xylaria longipes]|nr:hypothetical protein CHU98_g11186 [Xylaria longipes]
MAQHALENVAPIKYRRGAEDLLCASPNHLTAALTTLPTEQGACPQVRNPDIQTLGSQIHEFFPDSRPTLTEPNPVQAEAYCGLLIMINQLTLTEPVQISLHVTDGARVHTYQSFYGQGWHGPLNQSTICYTACQMKIEMLQARVRALEANQSSAAHS